MQYQQGSQEPQGQPQKPYPPQGGPQQGKPFGYGRRMWYLWGPVVIKWGISIVTSIAAMFAYSFFYMYSHYEETMKAMNSQEDMMNLSLTLSEQVMKYATQIEAIAAVITIPVMLILFHRDRKKEKQFKIAQNRKAPVWKYGAIVLISAAMCIGLNNLIMIGNLSAMSSSYEQTVEALYSAGFGMQLLCLGIIIPICEELVFRGLLFKRLRGSDSFMRAAVYSALVFGILHMNLVQMIYGFILGMLLAYLYEKYGSVKAPAAAHIVMNLISVIATRYHWFDWMMEDILRIGSITVVCAAVASTMFVFIQRIEEKPEQPDKPEGNEHLAAV